MASADGDARAKCEHCGESVEDEWTFCVWCGKRLQADRAPQTPPALQDGR
ncbi:MAG: zinc-ribbon domain-containing protein [Candidatus Brocadiia bacterium]